MTLESRESFQFIVDKDAACVSNTIRNMLSSQGMQGYAPATVVEDQHASPGHFTETEQGIIRFPDISTPILEKVCQYFYFKLKYKNTYAQQRLRICQCALVAMVLVTTGPARTFQSFRSHPSWPWNS